MADDADTIDNDGGRFPPEERVVIPRRRKYSHNRPSTMYGKKFSKGRMAAVLNALSQGATLTAAADVAGISTKTVRDWRAKDADFEAAYLEAVEMGTDVFEEEAARRAVDGVDEPHYNQGVMCGYTRKYSDTLLILLLKARRREKFGDKQEITGKDGGPVAVIARRVIDPAANAKD